MSSKVLHVHDLIQYVPTQEQLMEREIESVIKQVNDSLVENVSAGTPLDAQHVIHCTTAQSHPMKVLLIQGALQRACILAGWIVAVDYVTALSYFRVTLTPVMKEPE